MIPYLLYKLGIDVEKETTKFFPLILSFLFIRVFVDINLLPNTFFTVTPGVWILGIITYFIARKIPIIQWVLFFATLFVYAFYVNIDIKVLVLLLYFFGLSLIILCPVFLIDKKIALAHSLDIATTFVGLTYLGLKEKHVLSSLIGEPFFIGFFKMVVLYVLLKTYNKPYIRASIFVLGLLTGGRNFLIEIALK